MEKYNIAKKHLVPKQLEACGLSGKVTFSQNALYGIIDGYTREAGVRNLERTITSVLRKCARQIASGEAETVSVTGTTLEKLLGPRIVKPDFLNRTNAIGIANGLAWTSIGGETLPIEVQVIDNGSGKITVTGSPSWPLPMPVSMRQSMGLTRNGSRSATCTSTPRRALCPRMAPRRVSP